jgi:hypothetical protein
MLKRSRQKVCTPCAKSKRKCDQQLPCERCIERDVECIYPPPKRRRHNLSTLPTPDFEQATTRYASGDEVNYNEADWTLMGDVERYHLNAEIFIPDSDLTPQTISPTDQIGFPDSNDNEPWFLQPSTWILQNSTLRTTCSETIEHAPFVESVETMLHTWVRDGHCGFIHRRLYHQGMPTCMQDAFTTLAAYVGATPAVKGTVLQIADDRAAELVKLNVHAAGGVQEVMAHLARVQALFIYTFIRLFDGSVRLRASAQKQTPFLRSWIVSLHDAARALRLRHCTAIPSRATGSGIDLEYRASAELWSLWILVECVRRTHLTANSILNIYQTLTEGYAVCTGGMMLTASKELWDAVNVNKWFEMSCTEHAVLTPSLEPQMWLTGNTSETLDEFVRSCWTCVVGHDKLECWMERSRNLLVA